MFLHFLKYRFASAIVQIKAKYIQGDVCLYY
jgi:hypothetical protein